MESYLVWHIEGGLGKNMAATSLIESLHDRYPDRKIIIVASYPDVFINHKLIYRVYRIGNTQYFYEDYIRNKDTLVFRHEAYYESNHISKRKHIIDSWCKLMDLEYKNQIPVINFNLVQQRSSQRWLRDKPIFLIQTNGGPLNSEAAYSWARDIPFDISLKIAESMIKDYHIIQICKPSSRQIPGAEIISDPLSPIDLFLLLALSERRLLIDSCLQHAASALNLPSTVLWIATSPVNFGYSLHKNIIANPPEIEPKLPNSYLFDYSFDGVPYECPYYSTDEMFNIDEIIKSI